MKRLLQLAGRFSGLICILFLLNLLTIELNAEEQARPNVILIITDDQGYGDLSFYGNQTLQTPNLDHLASQSIRLDNFHVDPTCSPTRSALMTGRYSCRTGVWHTVMGRSILREDEVTMADYFQSNGYKTGIIGKWHLGDNAPYRPQDRGFEDVFIHGGGGIGQTPDFWGNDYFDDTYSDNGNFKEQTGYCTDVFFNRADQFITENRNQPFFLYLTTNAPHGPYNVSEKYSKVFNEKGIPSPLAEFYGMIVNIDENVGKLRSRLKELNLDEKTLLIFMTDNGTAAGAQKKFGFNAGMRGAKGSQYEGGHRVPCFWHWPGGGFNEGRSETQLTAHIDLLPTLVDLCQLDQSPEKPLPFDGISLASLLNGETPSPEVENRTLFVQSHRIENPLPWRMSAVLHKDWRLVDGKQLYQLSSDPGQKVELSNKYQETVKELRQSYEDWYHDVSGRFNEYCRIPLGTAGESPTVLTAHDWHTDIREIPWNQKKIAENLPGNGLWAVRVDEDAKYRFTLTQRPPGVDYPLKGKSTTLKIGDHSVSSPLLDNQLQQIYELDLKQGEYDLSGWIQNENGGRKGIYYIQVEKL